MNEGLLDLPYKLLLFLRSDRVRKVGVQVGQDLNRLFGDCGFVVGRHEIDECFYCNSEDQKVPII